MTSTKKIIGEYCYFINHRLGDGVSSEVYRGFHHHTKQAVAIKIIPKAEYCKFDNISMAEAELKVLQQLQGKPNILKLYSNTQTKHNIYIVTQLCEKGSLADVIKLHGKIPQAQALKYLKQLVYGYKAMADHQFIHRDIKPCNLLINAQDDIFIADFGLCIKNIDNIDNQYGKVGSPYYMAPEIINPVVATIPKYTHKSDIWAIGITFYEMLQGRTPWKIKNENELINSILSFDIQKHLPSGLAKISEAFLKRSLCRDPQLRMDLNEMVGFFQDENCQDRYLQEESKVNTGILNKEARKIQIQKQTGQIIKIGNHLIHKQHQLLLPQRSSKENPPKKQTSSESTQSRLKQKNKNQAQLPTGSHTQQNKQSIKYSKAPYNHLTIQSKQRRYRKTSFQDHCHLQVPFKAHTDKKYRKASEQINCEDISEFSHHHTATNQGKTLEELLTDLQSPGFKEKSNSYHNIIQKEDVSELQSGILKQLQGHINYFRLILKIWKKIEHFLKVNDNGISTFKNYLLYLFNNSLNQAKSLSHIKGYSKSQISYFKLSSHYENLICLLDNYQKRYQRQLGQECIQVDYKGDRDFLKLLSNIMSILYHNLRAIENDQDELNRKKILIFILEDLIQLGKAFVMSKQQNWHAINNKLKLSLHLDDKSPEKINQVYWKQVKDRFLRLTKGQQA